MKPAGNVCRSSSAFAKPLRFSSPSDANTSSNKPRRDASWPRAGKHDQRIAAQDREEALVEQVARDQRAVEIEHQRHRQRESGYAIGAIDGTRALPMRFRLGCGINCDLSHAQPSTRMKSCTP